MEQTRNRWIYRYAAYRLIRNGTHNNRSRYEEEGVRDSYGLWIFFLVTTSLVWGFFFWICLGTFLAWFFGFILFFDILIFIAGIWFTSKGR